MKRILPAAFLTIWAATFCLPPSLWLLRRAGAVEWAPFDAHGENREPVPRPSIRAASPRRVAWKDFGRDLEAWFNDAFPWRTELLAFHRTALFEWLKTPVGRDVPGRGGWVFRRGGDWPELDDYLGAEQLTPEELADWVALFEGRREWARAMGTVLLEFPATTKARARWQELYPAVRRHRGPSVVDQIRAALADSPARDDVLFADDDFEAAFAAGRETFFAVDHHPNAYGQWLLYDRINRRLRELFPDRIPGPFPWYDEPPPGVLAGREPGCWPGELRLEVSSPGESQDDGGIPPGSRRYPFMNISVVREGGGLSVLMAHDSFMRFTLASWKRENGSVRLPFALGVGCVRAYIFKRFTTGFLEDAVREGVPDVFIEQFPECRLDGSARQFLDRPMRAAAAFGRATEPAPGRFPRAGDRIVARAVLKGVSAHSSGKKRCVAVLRCGAHEIARCDIMPGIRRAVFFDPAVLDADGELTVSLKGCSAASADLAWRLAAP